MENRRRTQRENATACRDDQARSGLGWVVILFFSSLLSLPYLAPTNHNHFRPLHSVAPAHLCLTSAEHLQMCRKWNKSLGDTNVFESKMSVQNCQNTDDLLCSILQYSLRLLVVWTFCRKQWKRSRCQQWRLWLQWISMGGMVGRPWQLLRTLSFYFFCFVVLDRHIAFKS